MNTYMHLVLTVEAMAASKQPQQPLRPYLTSSMKSATLNTLEWMCILPVAAILMAPEAGDLQIWPHNGLRGHN